jgi:hypothetical protein
MSRGFSLTVDKPESLCPDCPDLFFQESLKLLPGRIDILCSEEIPYPFDCVAE